MHSGPVVAGDRARGGEYLAAALELLDEFGTAEPTFALTTKAAALASGTTRSTIYRHWSSVGALNDDAARYAICHEPGWELILVAQPADRGLSEALGSAISGERVLMTSAARATVTGWPMASEARGQIVAWERSTLEVLAAWLAANARGSGRTFREGASPRLAALTIGAYVEGVLLMGIYQHGVVPTDWPTGWIDDVSRGASVIMDHLTEERSPEGSIDRCEPPLPSMPAPPVLNKAQLAILSRMRGSLEASPFGRSESLSPGRLVDMARLARRCNVSERHLYRIWPTPEDLNVDLCVAYGARYFRQAEGYAGEALGIGFSDQFTTFDQLLVSALHAWVRSAVADAPATPFMPVLPLLDPAVRVPVMSALPDWSDHLRTVFVAVLAMARWYRRPEISADEFTQTMVNGVIGAQRLAALDPALLDESCTYRGAEQPVLGLVLYHLGRSMATTDPPTVHQGAGTAGAPPLAPKA